MKKLLIMMVGLATGAFAFGDPVALPTGTSFEQLTAGDKLDINKDDDGQSGGNTFWMSTDTELEATVTAYGEGPKYGGARPAQFDNATQDKFLTVQTGTKKPLLRTVQPNELGTVTNAVSMEGGLYVDTLVKFTAAETAPTPGNEDKLIVWVKGEENGPTNLVITAAYLEDELNNVTPTNYVATVENLGDLNAWHRVTVKAIFDITTEDDVPGFVVFVDGKPATCADSKGVQISAMGSLTAVAQDWNNKNALFPSLLNGASAQKLTAVGFEGSGAIDDVSFTRTAPEFAVDANLFTLTWNAEEVVALSNKVNSGAWQVLTAVDASATIKVPADAQSTVEVGVQYAAGYKAGTWTTTPDSGATVAGNIFTIEAGAAAPAGQIVAASAANIGTITINGVSSTFGTLADAFAAANKAGAVENVTIQLTANATVAAADAKLEGDCDELVLDLNGQTITGEGEAGTYVIDNITTLMIIDTLGGGKIVPGADQNGAILNEYELAIAAGTFDGAIAEDDAENTTLTGGKYLKTANEKSTLEEWIDTETLEVADAGDYWQVQEKSAKQVEIEFFTTDKTSLYSYTGDIGSAFVQSNQVLAAANDLVNQKIGYWWNGTWDDGDGTALDFPEVFPATGTDYYMVSTAITYRVGFDRSYREGDVQVFISSDDGEGPIEAYTVENTEYLGRTIKPNMDLYENDDPTGCGREFLGWTCEYLNITTPTKTEDLYCQMPENFNSWDNLGDIIFVANWKEWNFYLVSGGETNGYDYIIGASGEKGAYDNAKDGDTIVVGTSDAQTRSDDLFSDDKSVTIDLNGKTLTVLPTCTIGPKSLTVVDSSSSRAGKLSINGTVEVQGDSTLDLSGLTYEQTKGCTGQFRIYGVNEYEPGTLYFPSDVTYPECLQGTIDSETDTGAKIVVGGATYQYTKNKGWRDVTGWYGLGTEASPYLIENATDLGLLKTWVADGKATAGVFFKQTATITVTEWTGIGKNYKQGDDESKIPFSGTYNGNGQTLTVSYAGDKNYAGLFNYLTGGAVVKDLTIDASLGANPNDEEFGFGAVAGIVDNATIMGVTVTGTIGTAEKPLSHNAAGFVVRADKNTTISACTNNATIYGKYTKIGGIVGFANASPNTVAINDCVNNGTINVISNGVDGVGGIIGYVQNGTVSFTGCESKGSIEVGEGAPNAKVGSILGKWQGGSLVVGAGNTASASVKSLGYIDTMKVTAPATGLEFATVAKDVASFTDALAAGKEYKVMTDGVVPTFAFTEAGTIAFNTNLCYVADFSITGPAEGYTVTSAEVGNVVTFTCAKNVYDVTFTTNNFEYVVQKVTHGETLDGKIPELPVIAGHDVAWDDPAPSAATVVTSPLTYNATYTAQSFEVTFADGANSSITPAAGTSNLVYGTVLTITATAATDHAFTNETYEGWVKTSETVLTKANVTITEAATFTAPDAVKPSVEPQPITPGEPSEPVPQKEAEAQAAAINKNPENYIKAPNLSLDDTPQDYVELFQAKAVESTSEPGKYEVTLELKPEGYTTLSNLCNTAVSDTDVAAMLTDPEQDNTGNIELVIPGLYYRVIGAQSVDFTEEYKEGGEQVADSDSITLNKPSWDEPPAKAFYRIGVSVTPTPKPEE